jgi:hypothetical protein
MKAYLFILDSTNGLTHRVELKDVKGDDLPTFCNTIRFQRIMERLGFKPYGECEYMITPNKALLSSKEV